MLCRYCNKVVDNPYSLTFLIRTPIFEWCAVWRGSKNRCQTDMCFEEIKLRAQIITPILDSTISIFVGTYMTTLMSMRICTLTMSETFIRAPKIMRNVATTSIWIRHPACTTRRFHILGEVTLSEK